MKSYDTIVIGSGPSGLMCAINLKNQDVLLIEKNENIGGKIKVSGGGRCNLTNNKNIDTFIQSVPQNGKFLIGSLHRFGPSDIINFFEKNNLKTKEENYNRVFPVSNKSDDVIGVFEKIIKDKNIDLKLNCNVTSIVKKEDFYIINKVFKTKNLVIATGGKTYFELGTTGDGYNFAQLFNHTITELFPTECALVSNDLIIQEKELQGITLKDAKVSLLINNKIKRTIKKDIVITHFGISGPGAFELSYYVYMAIKNNKQCSLLIEPSSEDCPKKITAHLIDGVFNIKILETKGWKTAFVTAGGINLKEIKPISFESKLEANLFFIGEVLDINAHTGGYNISICFSEGFNCAQKINSNDYRT